MNELKYSIGGITSEQMGMQVYNIDVVGTTDVNQSYTTLDGRDTEIYGGTQLLGKTITVKCLLTADVSYSELNNTLNSNYADIKSLHYKMMQMDKDWVLQTNLHKDKHFRVVPVAVDVDPDFLNTYDITITYRSLDGILYDNKLTEIELKKGITTIPTDDIHIDIRPQIEIDVDKDVETVSIVGKSSYSDIDNLYIGDMIGDGTQLTTSATTVIQRKVLGSTSGLTRVTSAPFVLPLSAKVGSTSTMTTVNGSGIGLGKVATTNNETGIEVTKDRYDYGTTKYYDNYSGALYSLALPTTVGADWEYTAKVVFSSHYDRALNLLSIIGVDQNEYKMYSLNLADRSTGNLTEILAYTYDNSNNTRLLYDSKQQADVGNKNMQSKKRTTLQYKHYSTDDDTGLDKSTTIKYDVEESNASNNFSGYFFAQLIVRKVGNKVTLTVNELNKSGKVIKKYKPNTITTVGLNNRRLSYIYMYMGGKLINEDKNSGLWYKETDMRILESKIVNINNTGIEEDHALKSGEYMVIDNDDRTLTIDGKQSINKLSITSNWLTIPSNASNYTISVEPEPSASVRYKLVYRKGIRI